MPLKVLYEDNHLIAVYKPAGILVQADKGGERCLMDEVKDYLKKKYNKPGNVFLGLLHRLDRPVSGIILFAKTGKGASRLSEQFRNYTIEKIYHALVVGRPKKDKDTLVHYLIKDEIKNKVEVFSVIPARPAGRQAEAGIQSKKFQRAELAYEVIKSSEKHSLLKIVLATGRPHQIRAQLAAIGCPIVGDIKYGAPNPLPDKSIALAATSLSFNLATSEKREKIEIEPPFKV